MDSSLESPTLTLTDDGTALSDDSVDVNYSSTCEKVHADDHRHKTTLFAMLVGLTGLPGTDRVLGDTEASPYRSMKCRKLLVPTGAMHKKEVFRRSASLVGNAPQCKYWNKDKVMKWLTENPVTNTDDVKFLIAEEQKVFGLLNEAAEEKAASIACANWSNNLPWIRLYCAMVDDRARPYFLCKDDVMDREELDARNNSNRPVSFWQFVADLVNDPENSYNVSPRPELHCAFMDEITADIHCMPGGPISADEVKRRLNDSRAKLMKLIAKWELSGNGFGQRVETDENFGHIEDEQMEDGDNRALFLDGIGKEHLLLLWEFTDQEGILRGFLNKLSSKVAVDCENLHTDTAEVQSKRRLTDEQREARQFRESVSHSMGTLSCAALMQQLREFQSQALEVKDKMDRSHNNDAAEFYEDMHENVMEQIDFVKKELDRVRKQRTI